MTNYTYLGYGTTDTNGIAKLDHDANGNTLTHSYTGTGAGKIDLIASLDNTISESSIISNPYELLDCLFVGEGKTTGWLDGTSTTVTHVTLEDGIVKWTVPASSVYLGYRNNSASGLVGQSIRTTVKLTSTRNVRLSAFAYVNGSWSSALSTIVINSNTETDTNLTFTVPANTTQIWVRLQSNSSSDQLAQGDVVYINKFEIYPI